MSLPHLEIIIKSENGRYQTDFYLERRYYIVNIFPLLLEKKLFLSSALKSQSFKKFIIFHTF